MNSAKTPVQSQPTIFFIFGGTGDLTSRKLLPALYNLYLDGWMPQHFAIIGMGRTKQTDEQFRELLLDDIKKFSRNGISDQAKWDVFCKNIFFQVSEVSEDKTYV